MSGDLILDNNKENKKNAIPNIINFNNHESKNANKKDFRTAFRTSYMPKVYSRLNFDLERTNEIDEVNYFLKSNTNTHNIFMNKKPQEIIFNVKRKIIEYEEQITNLRKKWNLKKRYIQNNSKIQRFNKNKITELIKEKNDLQEINEKMLNILTEKELKNEDYKKILINIKIIWN